jgi:hypothetical protein
MQALALGALVAIQVAGCARVDSGARRDAAWSERLTQQAVAYQQEAARRERAEAASSQRLTELARAYQAEKERAERAKQAWSLRLTKLADHILSSGETN